MLSPYAESNKSELKCILKIGARQVAWPCLFSLYKKEVVRQGNDAGQQLEKAAHGASVEDSAEVKGPHATLAVKLQVAYCFACIDSLQDSLAILLSGFKSFSPVSLTQFLSNGATEQSIGD